MTLDRSYPPHPGPLPKGEREKGAAPAPASNALLRQALLSPRSVAIVGQSDDAGKTAGRPLKYLRQAGYAGRIYPVNARRDTVLGEPAWRSLGALPERPDHAYIVTPTDGAVAAVEECGRLGVPVATILADGFTESDRDGAARIARLRGVCAETGIRLVGPSSLGVVNLRDKVLLTANAAFAEPDLRVGRIFAASHSGSLIGAFLSRGAACGIGFAGLVSVGSEVDLSIGEICASTLNDPDVDAYLLFLETMRKADALRAFALAAAAAGKPILAYKLGRSAEARELAVSHTGALAGEDDMADAFLADCGIARADTFDGLVEGLPLLARIPLGSHIRVGVVTTTGGGASMAIDRIAASGVAVEGPSAPTLARLAKVGIEVTPARLIDLTIAGARYDVMKAALDILLTAPEFDLVLAVVGSSARFHPQLAVQPIVDCAGAAKPLAAFIVPEAPQALALLRSAGIPGFRTPEACADAIAAAARRRIPKPIVARDRTPSCGSGRLLDELEAGALLDRLGIARAPAVAIESSVERTPELPFAYPLAVKVLSSALAHKTDIGGVVLDVRSGADLLAAIKTIRGSVAAQRPDLAVERVLVQPMVAGLGEVLVGYRVDRDVGPLVMVAAGGVLTEIYRDRSLRLAPVDLAEAEAMIAEVKALKILAGYRGKPAGDLDALARAIVALSQLALVHDPMVAEAEINPLIVRRAGEGVVAVDALVKLA
ncbi:MAG: acetate--CoA ligase family protein [Xanthobacteraceae bacterium]